jgi:hypothetical protein
MPIWQGEAPSELAAGVRQGQVSPTWMMLRRSSSSRKSGRVWRARTLSKSVSTEAGSDTHHDLPHLSPCQARIRHISRQANLHVAKRIRGVVLRSLFAMLLLLLALVSSLPHLLVLAPSGNGGRERRGTLLLQRLLPLG